MELKEIITGMNKTFEDFKTKQDELEKAIKDGTGTGELKGQVEKIQDSLDKMEVKLQTPKFDGKSAVLTEEEIEYKSAFESYIRTGNINDIIEKKAMNSESNPDGGYMVTPVMANRIIERVRELSPMRQVARNITISNSNEYKIPREGKKEFGAGWVGEREARPQTDTPDFEMVRIPLNEIYAMPGITRGLITDSAFDWESYISRSIADKFARVEAKAFYTGDGKNKPLGILFNPASQGIELVQGALSFDGLIDLQTSLQEDYLYDAEWQLNRMTLRDIRKLKDTQGNYIWEPSVKVGDPNTILGYRYRLATDMPGAKTGAYSVMFGNFLEAYTIVDGAGVYTLRDEYTSKPNILFYTVGRVGGGVENNDAVKILQQQ